MKKTSKELRRLNPHLAKRAMIIEEAKIDVSESIRKELELSVIKRQIASKYAADEISYESLMTK